MIDLINPYTGTVTSVADERIGEYLGAGFKPVPLNAPEQKPTEPETVEEPKKEKKTTTRKKKG